MDASELLPAAPFDFEKEPLVDCSVELTADRLKGTVAWLIDCIRQQQAHLQSHDRILVGEHESGSGGTGPGPARDAEGEMSPPAPKVHQSVAKELESSMKDELLKLSIEKMQHELNTLPKIADLDRQRENLSAELAVLSSSTEQRMKEGEEKLQSELASATDDLRERLQRIGDDLIQRLGGLEARTEKAETSGDQLTESLVTIEERLTVRIESVQAAQAAQALGSEYDDNTLVGTSRTHVSAPISPAAVSGTPSPNNGTSDAAKPLEAALSQIGSTNATYSDAGEKELVMDRSKEVSALTSIVQDMRESFANAQMNTNKLEQKLDSMTQNLERLRDKCDDDRAKATTAASAITDQLKQMIEQKGDNAGSEVEAMRKEWLSRAACRGEGGAVVQNRVRADSRSKANKDSSRSPRPQGVYDLPATHIKAQLPHTSLEAEEDPKDASVPLEALNDLNVKLELLGRRMDGVQHDLGSHSIVQLDEKVNDLRKMLLPDDGPGLASTVSDAKNTLAEFQKWSKDVDRKFRRIAPLDSQFSDVQLELERLRKLFEFVEKVLPSDASKAMNFFTKNEGEKEVRRKSMKSASHGTFSAEIQTDLIDKMAQTLGPEVAFERHRDQLTDEVQKHEERMRHEFTNLVTAIGSLQREVKQSAGQTGDLIDRLARVEKRRPAAGTTDTAAAAAEKQSTETQAEPPGAPFLTAAPMDTAAQTAQSVSTSSGNHVSKEEFKKALEDTKDDIRNWLDVLHSTTVSALQQKADGNQLNSVLSQMQNVMGADGISTEYFPMLAQRSLYGRCASCDATNSETSKPFCGERRPVPVNKPPAWPPNHHSPGPMQLRPPMGHAGQAAINASNPSVAKLPKIQEAQTGKEFPRPKIFKNSSQPALRQVRTLEQSNDM